jgi:hypothetical protein
MQTIQFLSESFGKILNGFLAEMFGVKPQNSWLEFIYLQAIVIFLVIFLSFALIRMMIMKLF